MGQIIPFDKATKGDLASLQNAFAPDTSLVVSGGFPAVSIKGSKFAIVKGGEREVIKNPQTGDVASAIEVVIVAYNPNVSKIYYEHQYEDGTTEKPDCYSNDGITPALDAEAPQSKSCMTCPHNAWGSRITDSGKKAKACSDARRIAVAAPDQLNEPMLLRVPPTSMKNLGEYQKTLAKRNLAIQTVVTKLTFDEDSSSPLLHFRPTGLCDSEMLHDIIAVNKEDIVKQITGEAPMEAQAQAPTPAEEDDAAPLATYKKEPEPKKEAKPKKEPKPKAEAKPKKDPEPEPEPATAAEEDDDDLFAALDNVLGNGQ